MAEITRSEGLGGLPPPPSESPAPEEDEKKEAATVAPTTAAPTPTAPAKMTNEEMRVLIVRELVQTEATYVSQLELLRDLYVVPMRETGMIKSKHHMALFSESDLNSIIMLNTRLLQSLKSLVYASDGSVVFEPNTTCLGKTFLEFVQFLKMYQNYVGKHESGLKSLQKLKSHSRFQEYCAEKRMDARCKGLDMESLRILPIQRVPRYELFFRDLVKKTAETHPDFLDLVECKSEVAKVNAMINESMKKADELEVMLKIESRCVPKLELIAPARRFIKEAHLVKVSRKKDIRYNFVLFTDCLLYCTETSVGGGQLKWHHLLEFDKYFRVVDITTPNKKYGVSCFEIHSVIKSFVVFTGTPEVKTEWFKLISECLDNLRRHREELVRDGTEDASMHGMKRTQPVWFPDDFSDVCMLHTCKNKFTFRRRRHHCRYCGRLVCDDCSKKKLPDVQESTKAYMELDKVKMARVCDICFGQYKDYFPDFEARFTLKRSGGSILDFRRSTGMSGISPQSISPRAGDSEDELPADSSDEDDASGLSDRRPRTHIKSATDSAVAGASKKGRGGLPPPAYASVSRPKKALKISASRTVRAKGGFQPGGSRTPKGTSSATRSAEVIPASEAQYRQMVDLMRSKLDSERKKTQELEREVRDLKLANDKLKKAKTDLAQSYVSQIKALKKQLREAHEKMKAAGV